MRRFRARLAAATLTIAAVVAGRFILASEPVQARHSPDVHGSFTIHLILHAVGEEKYDIVSNADGTKTLTTTYDYSDRGTRRTTTATLVSGADERPLKLDIKGAAAIAVAV